MSWFETTRSSLDDLDLKGQIPVMIQYIDDLFWASAEENTPINMAIQIVVDWDRHIGSGADGETLVYTTEDTKDFTIVTGKPYRGEPIVMFIPK